jgi:eukaryotic-like serine/threonine-protein kinase
MGQVYLAFSPGGRAVAVKVIHPELARDQAFLARFRHEVAIARKVSGAYTAAVVDASREDEVPPWLATVFVAGPSLADAVADRGPLSEESLWRLAAGLVEALTAVHSHGLVHRDLKPANVLLVADGPRVIDFGIARALDSTRATATGMIVGTPSYMSPEQAEGGLAGPSSDVFSLGCVLAYAATGKAPFGGGITASVIYRIVHTQPDLAGVPRALRGLVTECLAKDPAERPGLAELMQVIGGRLAPANPGLSFWPPDLADVIFSYQAQLTSSSAAGSWPEPGIPLVPAAPHEATRVAAADQRSAGVGEQVTTHRPQHARAPALPKPSPEGPAGSGRPFRWGRRAAVLIAAVGVLATAGVIAIILEPGAGTPQPAGRTPQTGTTAPASPSTPAATPAVSLGCKILRVGAREIFNVHTVGAGNYRGTIHISFYDYVGSGDRFPGTTLDGATPAGTWRPVPAADIGASAEPLGCIATAR